MLTAMFTVVFNAAPAPAHAATRGSSCGANINPIVCENSKPGTPPSVWDLPNGDAGDADIQGFSTDVSVNAGASISFKINAPGASSYAIDIYRLGYYGGNGARKVGSITPSATLPQSQPTCLSDPTTNLVDCGNWGVSATWNVPSDMVSGMFIAKLTRPDNNDTSQITFVVRNDGNTSDIVFKTSDATWQAYNLYGGSDFYSGTTQLTQSQSRAFKISYNRPYATRGANAGRDFAFSNEYPTLRFLEENGYDVSYLTDIDADRYGSQLTNHKVFMSVGHDEYWSVAERTNVTAARDAGVNLMFLSGNEVYWHTRYEPSIDGSSTAYRTLVCYKTTWEGANTDPSGESTNTYRDPRFSTAPGGSSPENALSGTLYMANSTDLPITVTQAEGQTRLWRSTGLSSMSGPSTALDPHTVGYEADSDLDNGFRPAGLMDLSTTTATVSQYLQDFGVQVAPGTLTHSITLYRAASGALVFGAGTIQWGWGLDAYHDGDNSAGADPRIQQATLNMLADMSALPTSLMAGMTMPTPSTDTQAPTVTVTSPTAGATLTNGSTVTVTGTAVDNGGGVVTTVEVSMDGGVTYHRATGTTSWTYTASLRGVGAGSIKVRASDDSANLSAPVGPAMTTNCPCSVFGSDVPATPDGGDTSAVELGMKFSAETSGFVTGVRFYKSAANTGVHLGTLWSATGTQLATGTFTNETSSGWQTLQFAAPVSVTAGTTYVVSYYAPSGHYAAALNFFWYKGAQSSPLDALPNTATQVNGVYAQGHAFPTSSYQAANYYVDVLFTNQDNFAPVVTAQAPLDKSSSVAPSTAPSATFSKAMNPSSISFTLANGSSPVAGSVSYNGTSNTATFTPSATLASGTTYTATVTGSDQSGNALAPTSWSFTTMKPPATPGVCPCGMWDDTAVPQTISVADSNSVELGMKFTTDYNGVVLGVRFYKGPQNTGTHTGSLWSAAGAQLATATFTNESSTGWQTVTFGSPVAVTAGTTYTVSYKTTVGYYSATTGGLAAALNNPPLHTPAHGGAYLYGGGYPSNSSDANYWVDPIFSVSASQVPSVIATSPSSAATNVPPGSAVTATFDTVLSQGSPTLSVVTSGGTAVAGTTTLDSTQKVVTFTPAAALPAGTTFTATVAGAKSTAGTPMAAPVSWSFSTAGANSCPCTLFASNATPASIDAGDTSPVSLGVRFTASSNGYLTGVRFYKSAANTGPHPVSLWDAAGNRLATATATSETASGWQTATFAAPVQVSAGTVYTASYYTPSGHYSADGNFFASAWTNGPLTAVADGNGNGVYAYGGDLDPVSSYANTNYWVDPLFTTTIAAGTAPAVSSTSPIANASSVPPAGAVTATFAAGIDPGSAVMTLTDPNNQPVAGTTTYNAATLTAIFTPAATLANNTAYTASVTATSGGTPMASPSSWTFRTQQAPAVPGTCPCGLWDDTAVPSSPVTGNSQAVELGIRFTSDTAGQITGVRFYKGPKNIGTHTGSLWSAGGTRLATATFSNESAQGWQTVSFSSGVAVAANTTYYVSYYAPVGGYLATVNAFSTVGRDNPPLHVTTSAGAYLYGGGFPSNASTANYWVDPVFATGSPTPPPNSTPPVISNVAATGSGTSATVTWTTDTSSTSRVDYGTSATSLTSNATGATGTSHSVTLTGLATNTRYYYRVTSVDAYGNSATSPAATAAAASYAPATAPMVDTTTADFSGTASSTYVAANGDGEVVLAPSGGAFEFSGTALPAGWTSTANTFGGSSTVAGGLVTVSGANLTTTSTTFSTGRSLEALASLGQNQSIGWYTTSNSQARIQFTVNGSNQLVASWNTGLGNTTSAVVASNWAFAPHKYRIEWNSTSLAFYVDDVAGYTTTAFRNLYTNMRPLLSDTVITGSGGTDLSVDWLRIGPYAASGTYLSRIFDASAVVTWDALTWDATVPTGTTLTVRVRSGNTATPGTSWTGWQTVSASGGALGVTGRYLQYQLTMTSTGTRYTTPAWRSASLSFHV